MLMAITKRNKVDLGPSISPYYAKLAKKFRNSSPLHWQIHSLAPHMREVDSEVATHYPPSSRPSRQADSRAIAHLAPEIPFRSFDGKIENTVGQTAIRP